MITELKSPFAVQTARGPGRAIAYIMQDAGLCVLIEHADGLLTAEQLGDLKSTSVYVTGVPHEAATKKAVTR